MDFLFISLPSFVFLIAIYAICGFIILYYEISSIERGDKIPYAFRWKWVPIVNLIIIVVVALAWVWVFLMWIRFLIGRK